MIFGLDELLRRRGRLSGASHLAGFRWGAESHGITRDWVHRREIMPQLRAEMRHDHQPVSDLLTRAFGGPAGGALVDMLRRDGHLALSLVAEAAGTVIGHVALSPVVADIPALALAPVAVHPAMQGRGIGAALIRGDVGLADHAIIVLGEPEYYARFSFAPVDLTSPYAAPICRAPAARLPPGSRIAPCPGLSMI